MRAVIVYESMYGNTHHVASAIARPASHLTSRRSSFR